MNFECRSGCMCKKGYVLDVSLKKCVLPSNCSCHHGNKSYKDGDKIKNDCNSCVCKAGTWQCTGRVRVDEYLKKKTKRIFTVKTKINVFIKCNG